MTRWLIAILALTTPLTGCSGELKPLLDWTTVRPAKVVGVCPKLEAPPPSVVAALRADARVHPETGTWSVRLEKHYEQLDACEGAK